MNRVTHFDMTAENPEELVEFYSNVFGWTFEKWDGDDFDYWFVQTGEDSKPGINGGVGRGVPEDPVGVVNVIDVDDIDARLEAVVKAGGRITRSKHAITGVGWFALFADPQGIIQGVMQTDESAGS